MRKLITTTFLTLDGVMQAPGGPEEDTSNGFRYGGWSVPFWHDDIAAFMGEAMDKPFDLVLGRKTYDLFAAFWPHQPDEAAAGLNRAAKFVASRGTPNLTWDNSHLLNGNVVEAVRTLKNIDGPELQVHGSGDLIQTLLGGDIIDEMRVITYPVTVGSGQKLFGSGTSGRTFEVIKSRVAPNGVVMSVYATRGEVAVGEFGGE